MTCPECRSETLPGVAFCGYCGTPQGASVSQFPRTPGDQYVASAGPGQHGPPPSAPPREFRLDLRRLSRADQTVGGASLVVLVSLFLPWFGFGTLGANISVAGTTAHGYLGREIGVYLALLASAAAVIPAAGPVLRSWPGRR